VLLTDALPKSILRRMTLKGFGRDRSAGNTEGLVYTRNSDSRAVKSGGLIKREYLAEPREHGQFSRYSVPDDRAKPSFDFTNPKYWAAEKPAAKARKRNPDRPLK
jgi:hypothetical protein